MAKKGIKSVVQKMSGEIIDTRKASRLAQNERRKAQRRLARELEKSGVKTDWKHAYEESLKHDSLSSKAKGLQSKIESLTSSGEGYNVQIESVAESIKTFTFFEYGKETLAKKGSAVDIQRRNEMFQHQINQSTKKNGLSILEKKETHAFYAATQWIWDSSNANERRNEAIMHEFGLTSLEQVYKLIVNKELDFKEFGFEDKEVFEEWLNYVRTNIDLDELRKIYREEMEADENDEASDDNSSPSGGEAIKNIRIRTSNRFKRRHG